MTRPRIVGPRQFGEVAAALAEGNAIAVPGHGGYEIAVRADDPDALARLLDRESRRNDGGAHIVVGHLDQAAALTPPWSKETSQLVDRMWPGPLTVLLPATDDGVLAPLGNGEGLVPLTMPAWRPLRALCRRTGPLAALEMRGSNGEPFVSAEEACAHFADDAMAFVVNGGLRRGPGPTVVDCRFSPPRVRRVGALPESYIEATLLMSARRRGWFTRRRPDIGLH